VLACSKGLSGTRAQRLDDAGELIGDQVTADHLVIEVPASQHLAVEEVAERTVANVVEQSGEAQGLLDERRRRHVTERVAQRPVDATREEAGQMHGAEQMRET
jgi:hypothetical protein